MMGEQEKNNLSALEMLQQLKAKAAQKKEEQEKNISSLDDKNGEIEGGIKTEAMPALENDSREFVTESLPDLNNDKGIVTDVLPELKNDAKNLTTEALPNLDAEKAEDLVTDSLPILNQENKNIVTDVLPELQQENNPAQEQKTRGLYSGMSLQSLDKHREYILIKEISKGGTAEIWEVICEGESNSIVAKIYNEEFDGYRPKGAEGREHNRHIEEFYEAFKGEMVEGLIPILDYGKLPVEDYKYRFFYILPHFGDNSLHSYLNDHDMSEEEIINFIKISSAALNQMHERNFFHRDVKPLNIMYDGKNPTLIDYGSVTTGEIKSGMEMAITENVEWTQGYAAPETSLHTAEMLMDHKKEAIATRKSDFFSLGCVIAEIYITMEMRKKGELFDEQNKRMDTRLFKSVFDIGTQTKNGEIIWSDYLSRNKRIHNLVSALLLYKPENRAGYKEICDWLNGEELIVISEKNEPKFNYDFNSVHYDNKNNLALAMGKNWSAGIEEIKDNIDLLKDRFKEMAKHGPAYKTIYDFLSSIDSYYDNSSYEKGIRFDGELAEILMCIGGKEIPFIWRGEIYEDQNGKEDSNRLLEELYYDAKQDGIVFNSLVKSRAVKEVLYKDIRYVRDTSNDEDKERTGYEKKTKRIKIINEMAKVNPRKAKYFVAEQIRMGFLVNKLSEGTKTNAADYLTEIFIHDNFDKAMKNIYYDIKPMDSVLLKFLNAYMEDDEIAAMLLADFGVNIENNADINKMDMPSKLLMLIYTLLSVDESSSKNWNRNIGIFNAFYNSKFRQAVVGFVKGEAGYRFIDRLSNKEAAKAGELLRNHKTQIEILEPDIEKNGANHITSEKKYIDEFIGILKTIANIRNLIVYDRELLDSGLVFVTKNNINSAILAVSDDNAFCLIDGKFLLPRDVAEPLYASTEVKIVTSDKQDEVRRLSVDGCCKYVDAFFNNFKSVCGVGIEKIVKVKQKNLWAQLLLSFVVVGIGVGLILSGCTFVTSKAFSDGLVDKIYAGFVAAVDIILGGVLVLGYIENLAGAINNLKLFNQNRSLYEHYHKILATNQILQSMKKTGKLQKLNKEQEEIVDISYNLGNMAESYCKKNHLKSGNVKYYKYNIISVFFVGTIGAVFFLFNILPVRNMTGALYAKNIDYAIESSRNADELISGFKGLNNVFSKLALNMTEDSIKSDLLDSFNSNKLNAENYTSKKNKYDGLCKRFNYSLDERTKKALDLIVQSKTSFAKGNKIADSDKKKAVPYYLKVIPEDNNYGKAQKAVSVYIEDLQEKQQKYIESGDTKGLARIIKEYKKILSGNVSGNTLKDQYDILSNNDINEAARKLVAYQMYQNRKQWLDEDMQSISCVKVATGKYYVCVQKENSGLTQWFHRYSSTEYCFTTIGWNSDISVPESIEFSLQKFDPDTDVDTYLEFLEK